VSSSIRCVIFSPYRSRTHLVQGYWQRAIAAQPGTTTKAYLIGGALWFSVRSLHGVWLALTWPQVPFGFSTALGLAACATYGTDVYPGVGHVLTPEQLAGGLAAPGGAIALLGKTGATLMVVAGYMAVRNARCHSSEAPLSVRTGHLSCRSRARRRRFPRHL
jgi:hypothetical protein